MLIDHDVSGIFPAKNDILLIGLTMVFGFYSTIDLTCSKLFYLTKFNSQWPKSYQAPIKWLKFINVIILENIPQLIIQWVYIVVYSNNDSSDSNATVSVAYISMFSSLLSIFRAILGQIAYLFTSRNISNKNLCGDTKFKFKH